MVRTLRPRKCAGQDLEAMSTGTKQKKKNTKKMEDSEKGTTKRVTRNKENAENPDGKKKSKPAVPEATKKSSRLQVKKTTQEPQKSPEKSPPKKSQAKRISKLNDIFAFNDLSQKSPNSEDDDDKKTSVKKKKEKGKRKAAPKKVAMSDILPVVKITNILPKTSKPDETEKKKFFTTDPKSNAVVNMQEILLGEKRKPLKRLVAKKKANPKKKLEPISEEPKPKKPLDSRTGKGQRQLSGWVTMKKPEQEKQRKMDQVPEAKQNENVDDNEPSFPYMDQDENFDPVLEENQEIQHPKARILQDKILEKNLKIQGSPKTKKMGTPLYQKFLKKTSVMPVSIETFSPIPKIDESRSPVKAFSKATNFAQSTPYFPRKILGENTNLNRSNSSPNKTWRMSMESPKKVKVAKKDKSSEESKLKQFLKPKDTSERSSRTEHGIFLDVPKTPKHPERISRVARLDNFFGFMSTDGENRENSQEFSSGSSEKKKSRVEEILPEENPEVENEVADKAEENEKSDSDSSSVRDPFETLTEPRKSISPILFEDLKSSFTEPPKQHYRRKRPLKVHFAETEDDSETEELEISKQPKRRHKKSKKEIEEEKKVKEWVDSINRTFDDIDHYELVVE